MKKAVIFDMFETLATLWNSEPYMGKEMSEDVGIEESKFREIWDATNSERAIGAKTFEEVMEQILKANNRYSEELLHKLVSKRYAAKVKVFEYLHPDIIPMLQELKKKGIKIGLVTNSFWEEKDAICNSVLYPYFDVVCMSCELGIMKPDRRIFDLCVDRLGISAKDCLYCGDGGSNELEVARSMNMLPVQALWYLKENSKQPVGRLEKFVGARNPMDILSIAEFNNNMIIAGVPRFNCQMHDGLSNSDFTNEMEK